MTQMLLEPPALTDQMFAQRFATEVAGGVTAITLSSSDSFDPTAVDSGGVDGGGGLFETAITVAPQGATVGVGKPHGFRITIRGTCPLDAYNAPGFIEETFLAALRKIKPDANRPVMEYHVKRAGIKEFLLVQQNQSHLTQLNTAYTHARNARQRLQPESPLQAPRPGQTGAAPADPDAPFKDRLLPDEDVRNDTDFTLVLAVEMDPKPYEAPPPAEPAAAAQ
jgi:hypothetical protein